MNAEFNSAGFHHVTVLREEVVGALLPALQRDGAVVVDCTTGGGGHSAALLEAAPNARLVALDRDPVALSAARLRLAPFGERVLFTHGTFEQLPELLARAEFPQVDALLADLGVSSPQLDEAERGMSFRHDGPLDMRMDRTQGETALELIARLSQEELADVIFQLGEERRSRSIARCIKQALEAEELHTTLELRRAVVRAVGPRRVGGVDPATRTFQALRIAVNDELLQLEALLALAPRVLRPSGRAAIISFHSLEDRMVKRAFLLREQWVRLTPKPLIAGEAEQAENPRSRSAKLRVGAVVDENSEEP